MSYAASYDPSIQPGQPFPMPEVPLTVPPQLNQHRSCKEVDEINFDDEDEEDKAAK